MKILLMRVLGNDLPDLHGPSQTLDNLKFTLAHEPDFPNTTPCYLLNRIVDRSTRARLLALLREHDCAVAEIPHSATAFDALPAVDIEGVRRELEGLDDVPSKRDFVRLLSLLYPHSQHLIGANIARNYCLGHGFDQGYDWVLPLDSNSFFRQQDFEEIHAALRDGQREHIHCVVFPQYRLGDGNLANEDLLSQDVPRLVPPREPQVAISREAGLRFNEEIPYGCAPKAELLAAIGVPGPWNRWRAFESLGIQPRSFLDTQWRSAGRVFRLSPGSASNQFAMNRMLRIKGLLNLIAQAAGEGPVGQAPR